MKTFKCRNIGNCDFADNNKILHEGNLDEVRQEISTYKCANCERTLEEIDGGSGGKIPRMAVIGGGIAIAIALLGGGGYAIFGGKDTPPTDSLSIKKADTTIVVPSDNSQASNTANSADSSAVKKVPNPTPSPTPTPSPQGEEEDEDEGIDIGNANFDKYFKSLLTTKDVNKKAEIVEKIYKYVDKNADIIVKSNGVVIVPDGKAYSFFGERIHDYETKNYKVVDTVIDDQTGKIIKMVLDKN